MKIAQVGAGVIALALFLALGAQAQNLGINVSNPQSQLTVVALNPGGGPWTFISDVRAKENLHALDYGLSAVLAMKPFLFNYKGNPVDQKAIGFIAQDMQKIVPEVVDVAHDESKMMGIRYTELIPVLAKAIQQLKQEKDGQMLSLKKEKESQIQALQKENSELEARISSLEISNARLSAVVAEMEMLKKAIIKIEQQEKDGVQTVALKQP